MVAVVPEEPMTIRAPVADDQAMIRNGLRNRVEVAAWAREHGLMG